MEWWQAIILGIIEGVTEFLPVSSTGHLVIAQRVMGFSIASSDLVAFTAIIQIGAILAAMIYFWADIQRVLIAWWRGLWDSSERRNFDYLYGWAIILGTLPIAIVGIVFHEQIETIFRSLWIIVFALVAWSIILWLVDKYARLNRREEQVTWRDTVTIGLVQVLALVPGTSRSGATIVAGLSLGFDRVTATRLSFFLGIPALTMAGFYQAISQFQHIADGVGWVNTLLATSVSFLVGFAVIAWLLKFISSNNFSLFIWYRLGLAVLLTFFLVIAQ